MQRLYVMPVLFTANTALQIYHFYFKLPRLTKKINCHPLLGWLFHVHFVGVNPVLSSNVACLCYLTQFVVTQCLNDIKPYLHYIKSTVYTPDFAIYGRLHDERRSNGRRYVVFYKAVYGLLQHG